MTEQKLTTAEQKSTPPLIALTGEKKHGKSTIAKYLTKNNYTEYAFAGPLKQMCKALWLLSDEQLEDQDLKDKIDPRWGISPVQMFQCAGMLMREQLNKQFEAMGIEYRVAPGEQWIELFRIWYKEHIKNSTNEHQKYPNPVVVSDCRMLNEAKALRDLGAVIWRVKRPLSLDETSKEYRKHISETEGQKIPVDATIINDGNLIDLYNIVDKLYTTS